MTNSDDTAGKIIAAIAGAIGAATLEEKLLIPPRLAREREEGYNEGYATRDRELQPILAQCERERTLLREEHAKQQHEITELKKRIDDLTRKKETAPRMN
jgi:hypothetical protein